MIKRTLLLLFLAAHITIHSFSQPLCRIEHYSIDDGLVQGVIMSIVQDPKGFMWFGTWNGLNKFDGYTFQTYKAKPGDGCTLNSNRFEYIVEGKYDWIWCRTYDGKGYFFNPETETFVDLLQSAEKGPEAVVRRINALKKGVVWFICDKGLCFRIDEKEYRNTQTVTCYHATKKNIKGKTIYNILQDSDGDEWIFTDKGTTLIGKKEIDCELPFRYLQEVNNEIWLATADGQIGHYEKATGKVRLISPLKPTTHISVIKAAGGSMLAIGTTQGLFLYDTLIGSLRNVALQPSNDIQSLYVDKKKDIWAFTSAPGVSRWDSNNQQLYYLPPLPNSTTDKKYQNQCFIFEDNQNRLWVHPKGGNLNLYNRKTDKLQYFYNDPASATSLLGPLTHAYFSDQQGNLWLNTNNRELEKISFFRNTYVADSSYGVESRAFLQDSRQNIWISSKDGKVRIYNKEGELKGYLSADGKIVKMPCAFQGMIYTMYEQMDGTIWLGSKFNGLFLLKQKSKSPHNYSVRHYKHDPSNPYSLSQNDIYSIFEDSQKRMWIGCFGGGINLVEQSQTGEIRFVHSKNDLKGFPLSAFPKIRCISETPDGMMMVGTTQGLICFSSHFERPEEIRFHTHVRHPEDAFSLSYNDVIHIYTTRKKETYISTLGGGINKIVSTHPTAEHVTFKPYTQQQGLAFDWALSITEDSKGSLWIVSENTLTKFDPEKETFDNYNRNFLKHELYYSEALPIINRTGELVLGTNKGFIKINPNKISKSTFVPPIVLTDIKILNSPHPILTNNLPEVTLTPTQRNIMVEFAALDYVAPDNIRYAYKLDGLENDWNYVGEKRSASYINLPKGEYHLCIKSTNSDGVWVDNTRSLTIQVLPTFQETLWAWLLYAILLILFIITMVYILFYIYRLRHQVDVEQQISNIKLRFFTDVSHELRTPLTLIIGPITEILQYEELSDRVKAHLQLVEKNTNRMLRLINQILDFRKIQNKKMKLTVEETDVIQFLPSIMDSFRLIAEEKKIDLQLVSNIGELPLWIDKDKFEKIFFNLLSNAFKYTPPGKSIVLKVETTTSRVSIAVIDEGVGISPSKIDTIFQRFETIVNRHILQPSSGIGLSLVKELVELHHGEINVTSTPGEGCHFTVNFKWGKSHFAKDEQIEFILSDSNRADSPFSLKTEESENDNNEKLSILIVEDNQELCQFLKEVLSKDFHVLEASNGQEGYEQALLSIPHIIISDVMMPVMDGLDMVKAIKENKEICHIPIILLSAKSSLDDRIKGLEYGIDDYIIKPFNTLYLKARITSLLNLRKQLQENYRQSLLASRTSIIEVEMPTLSQPQLVPYDRMFIQQIIDFMEKNMDNAELTVDDIAQALALGRTVFYKKVKSIVGLSPVDFIGEIRIKRAIQLFDSGECNISQIAYLTGFNDPKYFSRCFKKQVGVTPKQYKEQRK